MKLQCQHVSKKCYYILKKCFNFIFYTFWPCLFISVCFTIIGCICNDIIIQCVPILFIIIITIYYFPSHKIGHTLLYNKITRTIHMRGYINLQSVNLDDIDLNNEDLNFIDSNVINFKDENLKNLNIKDIDKNPNGDIRTFNTIFKGMVRKDMQRFVDYIKEKKIKEFKATTHKTYYKILLEKLELIDKVKKEDLDAIETLEEGDEKILLLQDYIVIFKCLKRDKEITERAILLSYKDLFHLQSSEIIHKNQYLISIRKNMAKKKI